MVALEGFDSHGIMGLHAAAASDQTAGEIDRALSELDAAAQ